MLEYLCPSLMYSNTNSIGLRLLQYPWNVIPRPLCKYSFPHPPPRPRFFWRVIGSCVKSINSACLFHSWSFAFDLQFWWLFRISCMVLLLSYRPLNWGKMLFHTQMAVSLIAEAKLLWKEIIICHYHYTQQPATKLSALQFFCHQPPPTTYVSHIPIGLNPLGACPVLSEAHSFRERKKLFPSNLCHADKPNL